MKWNMKNMWKFLTVAVLGLNIIVPVKSAEASTISSKTYNWTQEDVSKINLNENNTAPTFSKNELEKITSDYYIWDTWPLQDQNGHPAVVNGYKIIFALSVPNNVLPGKRHDTAKISYFYAKDGKSWEFGGLLFNDGNELGSRQWAGSSIIDKDGKVHIFYTATGRNKEEHLTYEQRIATATATIETTNFTVSFTNWSDHKIILEPDGKYYQTKEQSSQEGSYAFRDPYFFQDPKSGENYLLFEANSAGTLEERTSELEYIGSNSFRQNQEVPDNSKEFNGSIGIAKASKGDLTKFEVLPPLLEANYVNEELERPSIIVKGNNYYLFTKTHPEKFATNLSAPEGLYGFMSKTLIGGYKPLNESGLVIANPTDNPYQAYSWMVMPNGTVISFVNYVHVDGKDIYQIGDQPAEYQMEHFGGMLAPSLKISITGDVTNILHEKKQGVFK